MAAPAFSPTEYPRGIDLIDWGMCPLLASTPMACMSCQFGHMLECHFPMDCEESHCGHHDGQFTPGLVETSANAISAELARQARIAAGGEHCCVICGCSESRACGGGCVWAKPNLCSRCVGAAAKEACP